MIMWTHFSLNGSFLCHIPIIQPLVHLTFFRQLRILDNAIYENHGDYVSFREEVKTSEKDLSEKVEEAFTYGRNNEKYQTEKKTILARFLEMKLLEAFLEAGPQFVFQIVVILQDGITGFNQILTVCTSAISLIWASSELYLKYPTEVRLKHWTNFEKCTHLMYLFQNFSYKDSKIMEQIVISLLMICNILGRILALAIVFSIMKYWGIIVLIIILTCLELTAFMESHVSKTKKSKSFLGILTSFISPCLIIKDDSKHFLTNGLIGSLLYIEIIWILYIEASFARNLFPNSPLTFECFHNFTTNVVTRCPLNATFHNDCSYGIFASTNQQYFTICPDNYDQWYFLWIICLVATGLLAMSLISIAYLHWLIDPVRRMLEGRKIKINTWPEKDANIKPFILKILNGEGFDTVNQESFDTMGKHLLELSVQSRLLHFTQVRFL